MSDPTATAATVTLPVDIWAEVMHYLFWLDGGRGTTSMHHLGQALHDQLPDVEPGLKGWRKR